ncbi:MAG: hypothetical protein OCD03_07160 [Hyphomicrobiales bacterium]
MYLIKNEIIVLATLLALLFWGSLISIPVFIGSIIYLYFYNKKMRYHIIRNDSENAMMLEGGMSQRKTQLIKLATILLLWASVWYYVGFEREFTNAFQNNNMGYEQNMLANFIEFWNFLTILGCAILTIDIAYKLFDSSVNSASYSKREVVLAGGLLIELGAGIYYFYHWIKIGDHSQFLDGNMAKIIMHIIIFAVLAASTLSLIVYGKDKQEAKDERDLLIEVKAYKYGFYCLLAFLALLLGQLIFGHYATEFWPERALNLNVIEIGNIILASIIFSGVVVSAVQLFFYRRGY